MTGKIIKGIAGFYYVHVPDAGIYTCKAKGIFRKNQVKPLVGDEVELSVTDEKDREGNIDRILPRRNQLIRPAVANIDQALVIFALTAPQPNFNLLDRFLVMMEEQGLHSVICFNKDDLVEEEEKQKIRSIYKATGYPLIFTSAREKRGIEDLLNALKGKTSTVAGPSGAGKSSLINCLYPEANSETGEISEKIERGKNTTRHSQLFHIAQDTYIMDTPGFSSLGVFEEEKENLRYYFPEFSAYEGTCRFQGCVHLHEPNCRVREALEEGKISRIRYENYRLMYEAVQEKSKNKYR